MNTKTILLAYVTRFGSTQQVAETIADTLRQNGLSVDVQPMQAIKSIDRYGAVVLGAAIYNAKWHSDAHQFLAQHRQALTQRPVAIFALGPLSTSNAAMRNSRRQLDAELSKYPWLNPIAVEMFVGKYDPTSPGLSFFEKLVPASDHRNWDAIRAWADVLPTPLQRGEVVQST